MSMPISKTDTKMLQGILDQFVVLKQQLSTMQEQLDSFATCKQDFFDNRSEKWQESETGAAFEQALEQVSDALASLTEVVELVDTITDPITTLLNEAT